MVVGPWAQGLHPARPALHPSARPVDPKDPSVHDDFIISLMCTYIYIYIYISIHFDSINPFK